VPPGWDNAAIAASAHKLALVDDHGESDAAADAVLHALAGTCRESPYRVAAESWAGGQDLAKHGIHEDGLDVARQLVVATHGLGRGVTPTNCGGLIAAYLVLREK
jgi:hypothetical protein